MLTYEEITSQIIEACKEVELNPYIVNNTLELKTLMKEFKCLCVTNDKKPPYITRAEIAFSWDSMMTSESIYGPKLMLVIIGVLIYMIGVWV